MTKDERAVEIAFYNDAFRRTPGPRWTFSTGVAALGEPFCFAATVAVSRSGTSEASDEPDGEHDFGAVTVEGRDLVWKIDCHDITLTARSPDPANPVVTRRVMTIMLAKEY
jgi:hypothetical protein